MLLHPIKMTMGMWHIFLGVLNLFIKISHDTRICIKVAYDMKYKMVWPSSDRKTVPDSWTQLNHHHENPSNKSKQIGCSYDFYKLNRHVFSFLETVTCNPPPPVMSSPTGCDPPNGKTSRVQAIQAPPPKVVLQLDWRFWQQNWWWLVMRWVLYQGI